MNKIEILMVGDNKENLKNLAKLVSTNEQWEAAYVLTDEEAIEKFHQGNFAIVVLAGDYIKEKEAKMRRIFTHQDPGIIIIQHYDESDDLLVNKIKNALDSKKQSRMSSISLIDDPLKAANSNITIQ